MDDPYQYLPTRGGPAVGGWSRGQNPIASALERAKAQYDYEEALRRERKARSAGLAMQMGNMFNSTLSSLGQITGGLANIGTAGALGTAASSGESGSMVPTTMLGEKANVFMPNLAQNAQAPQAPPAPQTPILPMTPAGVSIRQSQVPWWFEQYRMRGY